MPASLPEIRGTNVGSINKLDTGSEGIAWENKGGFYAFGIDSGVINDFSYNDKGEIVLSYANGWKWSSVQLFYTPTYAERGDTYHVRLALHSDVDGVITFNGQVTTLVWGWNILEDDVTFTGGDRMAISIQLGQMGSSDSETIELLSGSVLTFKAPEVYDATNTYHLNTFKVGEETVKAIQVRDGKTVVAPRVTPPEGKMLRGWFDEAGEELNPNNPVTKANTYTARFIDKSEANLHTVTYMLGDRVVYAEDVLDGSVATFDTGRKPLGYNILGVYADSNLDTLASGPVNEDTTYYLKAEVNPVTWVSGHGALTDEVSHGDNGEFILTFAEHTYDVGWHIQVNFEPLPIGNAGEKVTFTVDYMLDGTEGGDYKAYGNNSDIPDSFANLPPAANWTTITYVYDGQSIPSGTKFTFELGLVHPVGENEHFVFQLRNPWISIQ